MSGPILNITIPVFNRYHLTQKTLLALRKTAPGIPFVVTVVDNGSAPDLRERLVNLHSDGLIDNLFLLPRNMGISCACNIGWRAVDAPYYMKLDNDMVATTPLWLDHVFRLWAHGEPVSIIGPTFEQKKLTADPGTQQTPDGILGICRGNVPGGATIIPKSVSDNIGYWSEDYGLYGADDGDYGARLECAGVIQYCYNVHDCFEHCGSFDNSEYEDTELNKSEEHARLFKDESGGVGMFLLNYYLYNMCARNWKVPLRYRIKDMDGYNVVLEEDPAYEPIKVALRRSKELLDNLQAANRNNDLYSEVVVQRMKRIWRSCGQGCGD